jgi:hypothetical protein
MFMKIVQGSEGSISIRVKLNLTIEKERRVYVMGRTLVEIELHLLDRLSQRLSDAINSFLLL